MSDLTDRADQLLAQAAAAQSAWSDPSRLFGLLELTPEERVRRLELSNRDISGFLQANETALDSQRIDVLGAAVDKNNALLRGYTPTPPLLEGVFYSPGKLGEGGGRGPRGESWWDRVTGVTKTIAVVVGFVIVLELVKMFRK